jgi:ATP-binding cassette subfamily B protein
MIEPLTVRGTARHLAAALRLTTSAAPVETAGLAVNAVVGGVLPVAAAWATKVVVDRLGAGADPADVLAPAAVLAVLGLLLGVSPTVGRYLAGRLNRQVGVVAMDRLYRATERLRGMRRIEDPAFRDKLNLAQQAGRGGPGQLVEQALGIGRSLLSATGFVGALLVLHPWVALVALLAAVPALVAQLRLSRARATVFHRIAPLERRELHYAELLVSVPAAKELRLLGLGELFRGRMVREMRAANAAQERYERREVWTEGALALLSAVLAGACLLWAVWLAGRGRFTVGDVTVFVAAVAGLQSALQGAVGLVAGAHESLLLFRQFREVELIEPDLPVPAQPLPTPPLRDAIRLEDVWFRYGPDQPWVLRGVSLTIRRGESLALVGLNGAGKSTLIKLLCRFYDPVRGAIRWDGADLRDLDPAALRERIGAVFQDYMEYDLSAAENIGVGDRAAMADRARVVAAARGADVDGVVRALPRGYDTLLSRVFADELGPEPVNGVLLSGGQWQRIAIARALMRDRRDLLILDEPSSGLDAEAEHEIHRRLRDHRDGATSLLVSHRLAAVREADEIVVLADGVVAERGTHQALVAAGGGYARLFALQARGYEPVPT